MTQHRHIVKAFDQDLQKLTDSISAMGEFAATQFGDAVRALLQADVPLAQRVIDQDPKLDALRKDLSAAAAMVIVRRQPLAMDLDEVLADFRIVEELERIGDLAKNIAKRATVVAGDPVSGDIVVQIEKLAGLAFEQIQGALEAYECRDPQRAVVVRQQDEAIDELHTTIFKEIVARMSADQTHVVEFVHLLFCAKNIERVGDHATHVAEAAYLAATGKPLLEPRRRLDLSSTAADESAP